VTAFQPRCEKTGAKKRDRLSGWATVNLALNVVRMWIEGRTQTARWGQTACRCRTANPTVIAASTAIAKSETIVVPLLIAPLTVTAVPTVTALPVATAALVPIESPWKMTRRVLSPCRYRTANPAVIAHPESIVHQVPIVVLMATESQWKRGRWE